MESMESSINGVGKTGQILVKKMKLDRQLTPYTKINSKWIKDLNVRWETIKIFEDSIGNKITDIRHSNIFTDIAPRTMETKEKINKWDYIKIKSFCSERNHQLNKKAHCMGEYIC